MIRQFKSFSDFVQNATDEEKREVFMTVIDKANAEQRAVVENANQKRNGCWNPKSKNCDCPACGGFND